MTTLAIRDSTREDMQDVQRIYAHHVATGLASFEEEPPSEDEIARRRADVLGRDLPYLVAERAGRIVGYSYASPYRARSAYRYTVENSVYVDHAEVRGGVGSALLSALIGRCAAGPWRQMIAVIGDSANRASIRVHERAGFQMIGTLPAVGFKLGRWVDSVLMQRALGEGDRTAPRHGPGRQR